MTIDFHDLQRGDVLPEITLRVEPDDVRAYLEATGEAGAPSGALWEETVPPLAIGAFVLSALMEEMPLVPGTLHAGQEFTFHRPVPFGEPMTATITVQQRAERRGSLLTALALELSANGELVADAKTTLVNAAEEPGG